MSPVNNRARIDLIRGNSFFYDYVAVNEIESIAPELPGIYSWRMFIDKNSTNRLIELLKAISSIDSLRITATGNLQLEYSGDIRRNQYHCDFNDDEVNVLRESVIFADRPLYIGISKNLRKRLLTHRAMLVQSLSLENISHSLSASESDTEIESRCFGERMASVFKKVGQQDISPLYITYHVFDDSPTIMKSLRTVEAFFNRVLNPTFGRR